MGRRYYRRNTYYRGYNRNLGHYQSGSLPSLKGTAKGILIFLGLGMVSSASTAANPSLYYIVEYILLVWLFIRVAVKRTWKASLIPLLTMFIFIGAFELIPFLHELTIKFEKFLSYKEMKRFIDTHFIIKAFLTLIFAFTLIAAIISTILKVAKKDANNDANGEMFLDEDAGTQQERCIAEILADISNDGKVLRNIYLPMDNGETTEIDVLSITPKGIFVIESKNYKGWIFGSYDNRNWTATYSIGRGREAEKHQFYNPIKQNNTHINYLRKTLGYSGPIWSLIVFSDDVEFKEVPTESELNQNQYLIYLTDLKSTVKTIIKSSSNTSLIDVNKIYEALLPYTEVSKEDKEKHIEYIENRYK